MPDDRPARKRKGSSKNRNVCAKLFTDSRFYKHPKRKRKTSFRDIASAVRESQFVCIVVLQFKSEWMGFLTEPISKLTGA